MQIFGDIEGKSFHFWGFDRVLKCWTRRRLGRCFGSADPLIELGFGADGDFFAGGFARSHDKDVGSCFGRAVFGSRLESEDFLGDRFDFFGGGAVG